MLSMQEKRHTNFSFQYSLLADAAWLSRKSTQMIRKLFRFFWLIIQIQLRYFIYIIHYDIILTSKLL